MDAAFGGFHHKEGLWGAMALTGVDLLVAAHAVGVHDALEAGREAGGADKRWGHVPAGDTVNHCAHTCLALGCPAGRPADRQTDRQMSLMVGPSGTLGSPSQAQVETHSTDVARGAGTWDLGQPFPCL